MEAEASSPPTGRSTIKVAQSNVIPVHDCVIEGESWALVPDGEYVAKFLHHETATVFKTPKVFLHFEIVGPSYGGVRLFAAFRVKRLIGPPCKHGRFALSRRGLLTQQIARLHWRKFRLDRISVRSLRHCLLRVETRTVATDYRQREVPESLRYSVVAELLAIEAGSWGE